MKVYENLVEQESPRCWDALIEAALELYGLTGAQAELVNSGRDALFQVAVPIESGTTYHPYLGRVDGKRFMLQVRDRGLEGEVTFYSEVAWLAELLRETDVICPEPVPAWDGSLVAEIASGNATMSPQQCVLFRLPEAEMALNVEMLAG